MATTFARLQSISTLYLPSTKPANSADFRQSLGFRRRHRCYKWKALDSEYAFQGTSSNYAKEMERLSAKESLRLAFKDSGGFKSLVSGKETEMHRIDVNERIVSLERLNPTPRPTTSHLLEGRWNFEWLSAGSPGLFASKLLFERSPATLAALVGLDVLIKDGYAKIAASLKFLNSVQLGCCVGPHTDNKNRRSLLDHNSARTRGGDRDMNKADEQLGTKLEPTLYIL